jgi:O-antigen/teichoic acid export membrane protein
VSTLKNLASQTAVYGLSQIVGRLVNYLLVPLHTALFATGEYGVNTLMYSYVTFFNVLLTYGMETAFFRFSQKSENPNQVYSTALTSLLSTSVFFALLFSVTAQPIANLIQIPQHPEYVIYFALIISLDAISAVPFAYLRQQNKALKFAVIKNINIFTNILLNLYFLLLCPWVQKEYGLLLPFYNGEIHIGYIFIANLFASIITLPLLTKELLAIRNASFNKTLWREMLVYGLPLMVVGFAGMINETLDRIIISYSYADAQKGLEATGIYGANYKLSILMSLFIQAFRYAAEPFFFNHAKTNDKRTIYARVMNYFVLVCLGLFLLVTLYIDLFKHFISSNYWEGLHVVPVLLIANLFLGVYFNLSIWYKLSDNTNKGAMISLAGAAITIAANMILVPRFGYTGSAWATLICYVSMAAICYVLGAKYYPIPYQVGRLFGYLVIALLIYVVCVDLLPIIKLNDFGRYSVNALFLLGFAALAFVFERKNKVLTSPN